MLRGGGAEPGGGASEGGAKDVIRNAKCIERLIRGGDGASEGGAKNELELFERYREYYEEEELLLGQVLKNKLGFFERSKRLIRGGAAAAEN